MITGFDEDRPFLREIVVGLGGRNRHRVRGVDAWESCARWYVQPTDVGTFLLVVTSDPTWRIEALLNEWTPIEIAEASGFGVGLLELDEPLATPDIRAYEFDETPVTCLAEL